MRSKNNKTIFLKIGRACLRITVIFVFWASILALLQRFGWSFAIWNTPPFFGVLLAVSLPISVCVFYTEKDAWFRRCSAWATIVSFLALVVATPK